MEQQQGSHGNSTMNIHCNYSINQNNNMSSFGNTNHNQVVGNTATSNSNNAQASRHHSDLLSRSVGTASFMGRSNRSMMERCVC
eukprot:scaffold659_cov314-Alexandrium_tamarense.AAC.1